MIPKAEACISGDVVRGMPSLSLLTQWPLCALLRGEDDGSLPGRTQEKKFTKEDARNGREVF